MGTVQVVDQTSGLNAPQTVTIPMPRAPFMIVLTTSAGTCTVNITDDLGNTYFTAAAFGGSLRHVHRVGSPFADNTTTALWPNGRNIDPKASQLIIALGACGAGNTSRVTVWDSDSGAPYQNDGGNR